MKRFLGFLKPTPFKAGLATALLAAWLYYYGVAQRNIPELSDVVATLDWRISDSMFRIRGAKRTSGQVLIVDIDEKSLQEVEQGGLGQWPWPRTVMAKALRQLTDAGVKVIGLDFVYAERDRTSPIRYIDLFRKRLGDALPPERLDALRDDPALDNDKVFAEVLYDTPTILGYFVEKRNDALKGGSEHSAISAAYSVILGDYKSQFQTFLRQLELGYRPVMNLVDFRDACMSAGFFNPTPDIDGVVRRVPLLMLFSPKVDAAESVIGGVDVWKKYKAGVAYPALSFEMLREGMQVDPKEVQLEFTARGIAGLSMGDTYIPTDSGTHITVNYRGPSRTFPYISFVDVYHGRVAKSLLKDKYVLIGPSAGGLQDLRATPFDQACPGVEVHANIIDNVLSSDAFRHDVFQEWVVILIITVVGGTLLSLILAKAGPLVGGLAGIGFVASVTIGNYHLFFLNNEKVGTIYPLATCLAVFAVVTLFNFFTEGRQKRFIHGAFGRYVAPAVVTELMKSPDKLSLGGEKKELTVLFSDIRGFTSISEKMDPGEMSHFLNEYLTAMSDIIMEQAGTVDKFIGDAIMAIWGAPLDDALHARNAAVSALRMMKRLAVLQQEWDARGLPRIDIGIGINTGSMSVGNMGSRSRFDYTVIGDNVNLAARLEGANKAYGTHVIITEPTWQALGDGFYARLIDLVRVKGKIKPVKIYELMGEGIPISEEREQIAVFEEARMFYESQQFDKAEALLRGLQESDLAPLYDVYLDRIRHFRETPPPKDWDGAFTFTTK